jgi:hypothetical protein
MSAIAVEQPRELSARSSARMAGVFYLLNILTIFLAIFLFRGLFVSGDAVATARNIGAHRWLFQSGFASELISTGCSLAVAALLYHLLGPVNRSLSLLAAFCRLVACCMFVVNYLFQLAPLNLGGDELQTVGPMLSVFRAESSSIGIVFFAFHFVVLGYLIVRSYFLPCFLGLLLIFAGLGALAFLVPSFGRSMFIYFAPLGLIAEISLTAWLIAKGVNVQRWQEQFEAGNSLGQ